MGVFPLPENGTKIGRLRPFFGRINGRNYRRRLKAESYPLLAFRVSKLLSRNLLIRSHVLSINQNGAIT